MSQSVDPSGVLPQELDLTRYVAIVARRWWLILITGVLGVLAAFAMSSTQPVAFRATSHLALLRTGTTVNLDARVRTVSDSDPNTQTLDQLARRRALVAFAESDELPAAVVQELGAQLPSELASTERLRSHVSTNVDQDVIDIQATMPTAESAVLVANAYARAYEKQINAVFGEQPLTAQDLQPKVAQAKQAYDEKQNALTTFLAANQIESLQRQVDVLTGQLDSQVKLEIKLAQLEQDAIALRNRLKDEPENSSLGTLVAALLMEANAYNNVFTEIDTETTVPVVRLNPTELNITNLPTADQVSSLDDLIQSVQARRRAQTGQAQDALYAQLNTANAQYEIAQGQLKELQAARDLAWDTYQLLATKQAEAGVSAGYQNQIVRIMALAAEANRVGASRFNLNLLIGGMLGVVVGIVLALVLEWLPFGKKRAAVPDAVIVTTDRAPRSN